MKIVVDTNVPKAANGRNESPQASPQCVTTCVQRIRDIQLNHVLVLDDNWHILREYMAQLRSEGQPGVGDAFLKWVLTHQANPLHCEQIHITAEELLFSHRRFVEFPSDERLAGFDPSDRKFVAVSLAHPDRPPILNAVDSDWLIFHSALAAHGVRVETLCPESIKTTG
jgi:hypothetical protein